MNLNKIQTRSQWGNTIPIDQIVGTPGVPYIITLEMGPNIFTTRYKKTNPFLLLVIDVLEPSLEVSDAGLICSLITPYIEEQ